MILDNDFLLQIQRSPDKLHHQEIVFMCQTVQKLTKRNSRTKRILLLTQRHFSLYEPKVFQKDIKLKHRQYWDTFTSLASPPDDPHIAEFAFSDKKISIFADNASDIIIAVARHLKTVFTPAELSMDSISVPPSLKKQFKRHNDGFLRRLRFKSYVTNQPLTPALDHHISSWLHGAHHSTFDVSSFIQFPTELSLLFDALLASRDVALLKCPQIKGFSFWPHLTHFFSLGGHVPALEIHGIPNPAEFGPFLQTLIARRNATLQDIRFCNGDFDSAFMVQFPILIQCCAIARLTFENQITQDGRKVFVNLLSSVSGFQHLRALTLVGCPGITPTSVLTSLPSLRYLHWDDSEVEVGVFMNELCALKTCELDDLVLKNGNATAVIGAGLFLPPKLATLSLTGIAWAAGTLESFFRLCASGNRARRPLALALSDAQVEDWDAVDALLLALPLDTLSALAWDSNPVGHGFAALLARNPALGALSIGCAPHAPDVVEALADFVQASDALRALAISGGADANFRDGMEEILMGACGNTSLVALDVSGNGVGDSILVMVGALLRQHPAIARIAIDGNGITSREDVESLFGMLGDVGRPVQLQFPHGDFVKQQILGAITEKEVERFRNECLGCLLAEGGEGAEERVVEQAMAMAPLDIPGLLAGRNEDVVGSVFTESLQAIVRGVAEEFVCDERWVKECFVQPPLDSDERLMLIKQRFEIERLVEEIRV